MTESRTYLSEGNLLSEVTKSEIKMKKPSAYISAGGILFKESPPDSMMNLIPLYALPEVEELQTLVIEQNARILQLERDLANIRSSYFERREKRDSWVIPCD